jgi:phosphoglycerol transferase MdoB-like AlkP superfamily enzyme
VGALVAANLLLFFGYHFAFVRSFAADTPLDEVLGVLWRGFRFDAALLGQELLLLVLLALVTRHLRYRVVAGVLWGLTIVHALVAVTNLLVYGERNQQTWEVLLANITEPREVWIALAPFLAAHPAVPILATAATAVLAMAARRHLRSLRGHVDLWQRHNAVLAVAALLLVALPSLDLEPTKRPLFAGYRPKVLKTKRAMGFTGFATNQALVNPVYNLFYEHLPAVFSAGEYRLGRDEALATTLGVLELPAPDPRYPLLRTIEGRGGLGIENVVILQVEGLGASILEHRVGGTPVMPFLAGLAAEGLYLTNVYQNFGHTDGAVYATVTGLPATPGVVSHAAKFSASAVRRRYGSLARILGKEGYRHYAFGGFRQRIGEFVSFMGNQGYETAGFDDIVDRLGPRAERDVNRLGVFDHPLLQEVARTVAPAGKRFTVHVMTSSSHSPWMVPEGAPRPFGKPPLDVFRYVDDSLRAFVDRLRAEQPGFARTLFVILGDHTSFTLGSGLRERLRIPVVFWGEGLDAHRAAWAGRETVRGSEIDIVPTILGLLDGSHRYAGMGHDLLADRRPPRGAIVGGNPDSYYITDGFALQYTPDHTSGQLFPVEDGEIVLHDVGARHPEILRRLRHEFLALQETADRLTVEGRVVPP